MATLRLRGTDRRKLGCPEGRATTQALDILAARQLSKLDKGSGGLP